MEMFWFFSGLGVMFAGLGILEYLGKKGDALVNATQSRKDNNE